MIQWIRIVCLDNEDWYDEVIEPIEPSIRESVVALLLLLFSDNLQSLQVHIDDEDFDRIATTVTMMGKRQLEPETRNSLPNLRRVDFRSTWRNDVSYVFPFLQLKSLKEFKVSGLFLSCHSPLDISRTDPLYATNITIECGGLDPESIHRLLSRAQYLKRFEYKHQNSSPTYFIHLGPSLRKALASSSNCLEELILRGNNTYDEDQDQDGKLRLGPLGSLTEFERLRYVT